VIHQRRSHPPSDFLGDFPLFWAKSFEGNYVALEWALELVVFPSQDSARLPITIGPGGKQVSITHSRGRELSSNIFDWLFNDRWPTWDELD